VIARVRATDADAGANAILTYTLEADQNDMFSITPETGEIRLEKNRIGPESSSNEVGKETVYHLVVVASDGGAFAYYYYYYYCFFSCLTGLSSVSCSDAWKGPSQFPNKNLHS